VEEDQRIAQAFDLDQLEALSQKSLSLSIDFLQQLKQQFASFNHKKTSILYRLYWNWQNSKAKI
jgi:hypothetical protein